MKGDFSRIRFNPAKHYTALLKQQGRVDLDADANEQSAIDEYLRETTNIDVIGRFGGPIGDAGFAITIEGERIMIGPGRYYVDGILVENRQWMPYDDQPFLKSPTYSALELLDAVSGGEGNVTAQLRLEVWQRLVTDLDDNCLREPALGQADTTVRLQSVWRVVGATSSANPTNPGVPGVGQPVENLQINNLPAGNLQIANLPIANLPIANLPINNLPINNLPINNLPINNFPINNLPTGNPIAQLSPCCQALYTPATLSRTGALGADTGPAGNDCGCQPIAGAGYQGLENQLYRVEIHTGGTLETATFKWSRENGSVVQQVTGVSGSVVTVSNLPPDVNLGFQIGQWVELSDDNNLFGEPANQQGILYQILGINQATLQVTMTTSVAGLDTTQNARMRRWDQTGASATPQGVALSVMPVQLENGIEVTFRSGNYQAGDYWTIPARTANGQIDWPPCGGNGHFFQPARYIEIFSAPLACIRTNPLLNVSREAFIEFQGNVGIFVVDDCRLQFPPLTAVGESTPAAAMHVSAISWTNDDVMTVDTLVQNGLSVTFDQAPVCPWGGGNFRVTLEAPFARDQPQVAVFAFVPVFNGTNVFVRTESVLDPPFGIAVSGAQVSWTPPLASTPGTSESSFLFILYEALNTLLGWANPIGFGRVRVKLYGGAVYASGAHGNIYLDGLSFGQTGSRAMDGSASVNLIVPSGSSLKASDYEGWFYLAPTIVISSATIQLLNAGTVVGSNAVTVNVNQGALSFETTATPVSPAVTVTAVQAVIGLNYPPIAPTTVTLTLTGTGAGTVVTIQGTATVAAGKLSVPVPINILASPGSGNTDTVTLTASVAGLFATLPFGGTPPTLAIFGGISAVAVLVESQ